MNIFLSLLLISMALVEAKCYGKRENLFVNLWNLDTALAPPFDVLALIYKLAQLISLKYFFRTMSSYSVFENSVSGGNHSGL